MNMHCLIHINISLADTIPARIRPRPRNSKTGYGEIRGRVIFQRSGFEQKTWRGGGSGGGHCMPRVSDDPARYLRHVGSEILNYLCN